MAEKEPDVYDRLTGKYKPENFTDFVRVNTAHILDIAIQQGATNFEPEAATALATLWTANDMDDTNVCKTSEHMGASFRDLAQARINAKPSLIGIGSGAEISDINKADLQLAFGPTKNATALGRLVQKHGLPKINNAARLGGLKDAFDKRGEYRVPGHSARASEVEDNKPARRSGEVNPWLPNTFNLTAQARIWLDDPTKAKKLMEEAGATRPGMTQKQLRGGR